MDNKDVKFAASLIEDMLVILTIVAVLYIVGAYV